jgi:aspartate aminotransferase
MCERQLPVDELAPSPMRSLMPLVREAEAAGKTVIPLSLGEPDIKFPTVFSNQAIGFLRETERMPYTSSDGGSAGEKALQQKLVWLYGEELGTNDLTPTNFVMTEGASEAIAMTIEATTGKDEEILVFEPTYAYYGAFAERLERKLVGIETDRQTGFHLPQKEAILARIGDKTKTILLNSPNNPTGATYTEEELRMILEVAREKNLMVISDEVYRILYYGEGGIAPSILQVATEEDKQRIVVIDSFSKRYGLCGLRLGFAVAYNQNTLGRLNKLANYRGSAGLLGQKMAEALDLVNAGWFDQVRQFFVRRRDFVASALSQIPGVELPPQSPEGAFYFTLGLPVDSAYNFCRWLLTDYQNERGDTILLAPMVDESGRGFYLNGKGKNEVRLAFVVGLKHGLVRSIEILKDALSKYPRRQ